MRSRRYDSSNRQALARLTRRRILDAAARILLSDGYDAMTVARLAEAAHVSPQTIYNAIGTKAQVVKATYDVTLAGDDEPTPMSERPQFRAMRSSADPAAFMRAYASWTRHIYQRVGPLLGVLLEGGAGGDPALREFIATIEAERRTGNGHAVDLLESTHGPSTRPRRAVLHDVIWTLTAPEVADRLIRRCGWSLDDYERWLGDHLTATVQST